MAWVLAVHQVHAIAVDAEPLPQIQQSDVVFSCRVQAIRRIAAQVGGVLAIQKRQRSFDIHYISRCVPGPLLFRYFPIPRHTGCEGCGMQCVRVVENDQRGPRDERQHHHHRKSLKDQRRQPPRSQHCDTCVRPQSAQRALQRVDPISRAQHDHTDQRRQQHEAHEQI